MSRSHRSPSFASGDGVHSAANQHAEPRSVDCPAIQPATYRLAFGGVLQPKLSVNAPGDRFEQEADRVADAVLRMPEPAAGGGPPAIQRLCAECEEERVQRQLPEDEDEREPLQAKATEGAPAPAVSPRTEARISGLRGGGRPLPAPVRGYFEPRLGRDLGAVRVHTGSEAADATREVRARAFTVGSDIAFGAGEWRPETDEGRRLLAHELVHTVQQRGDPRIGGRLQRRDFDQTSLDGDRLQVRVSSVETTGDVRQWAGPRIVTTTGDRLPYYCETEVPRANLPYTVEVGVRSIAVGTVLVRHRYPGLRMPRWRQARRLTLPAHAEPPGPAEGREFFVRLESAGGTPVEYSAVLIYDTQAVELSRILHAEAGASLEGMRAIAHVIANRMRTGTPAAQVDTTSPWPESFINTGFLLNAARPRADWPRVTSTAARLLARAIIRQGGVAGADPTEGARFYRSAGAPGLETTRPAFIRLRESVEAGDLRRVTVGGNVFYAPVAEAP